MTKLKCRRTEGIPFVTDADLAALAQRLSAVGAKLMIHPMASWDWDDEDRRIELLMRMEPRPGIH